MNNFMLLIEYDGTNACGWQRQANDRTIQGDIESAIRKMTDQPVSLIASGRTDSGVHALQQVANFSCDTDISAESFKNGINGLTAADIVIKACFQVDPSFHARYDAKSKMYRYCILNRPLPVAIGRQYAWHVRKTLDVESMNRSAAGVLGTHDFKAFEGVGSPRASTIRTVSKAVWNQKDETIQFEIQADGFLRYMVRNLVGSMVEVGLGKISLQRFHEILVSKDRSQAGPTAPPHGLFLVRVDY